MSHTTIIKSLTFIHDGDYGGIIEVVNHETNERIQLPSDELFEFFGRYLQSREETRLADLSGLEYLKELTIGKNGRISKSASIGTY